MDVDAAEATPLLKTDLVAGVGREPRDVSHCGSRCLPGWIQEGIGMVDGEAISEGSFWSSPPFLFYFFPPLDLLVFFIIFLRISWWNVTIRLVIQE